MVSDKKNITFAISRTKRERMVNSKQESLITYLQPAPLAFWIVVIQNKVNK